MYANRLKEVSKSYCKFTLNIFLLHLKTYNFTYQSDDSKHRSICIDADTIDTD